MNYSEIKRKIRNEAQLVKVATTLGTAATISKKQAYRFLDMLERRNIKVRIDFTEIGNGKLIVLIDNGG